MAANRDYNNESTNNVRHQPKEGLEMFSAEIKTTIRGTAQRRTQMPLQVFWNRI